MNRAMWMIAIMIVSIAGVMGLSHEAKAAQTAPSSLHFQGRLADASGTAMPDGLYNIRFKLYLNNPTGGTEVWTETHDAGNRVQVKNGLFTTRLGVITPFSAGTFTSYTQYVEVELPTTATATCDGTGCSPSWSEGPMSPRQLIAAAPYAMNADTVDGIDGASLAQLSTSNTFTNTNLFRPGSDSTTAFQIQKSDNTPLFVADTTNMAIKIGGGDVSPSATPALLVLDYKNTSGDPSGTNGAMYYNSNTNKYRCYEDSAWKDCVYSDPSIRNNYSYRQDFLAGISLTPPFPSTTNDIDLDSTLTAFTNGNNSFVSSPAHEVNHPGIWRLTTGTTTTGAAYVASPALSGSKSYPYRIGEGAWSFASAVRVANISATGNLYTLQFGLTAATLSPASGCQFRYNISDYSGDWAGVCGNGSTESKCDVTDQPGSPGARAVAAATWYNLYFIINSAGTLATFTLNNTYSCTVSTNIPTGTNLSLQMGIQKTTGTTSRTADLEYLDFSYDTSNR